MISRWPRPPAELAVARLLGVVEIRGAVLGEHKTPRGPPPCATSSAGSAAS